MICHSYNIVNDHKGLVVETLYLEDCKKNDLTNSRWIKYGIKNTSSRKS